MGKKVILQPISLKWAGICKILDGVGGAVGYSITFKHKGCLPGNSAKQTRLKKKKNYPVKIVLLKYLSVLNVLRNSSSIVFTMNMYVYKVFHGNEN